jgi:hypothetical protein
VPAAGCLVSQTAGSQAVCDLVPDWPEVAHPYQQVSNLAEKRRRGMNEVVGKVLSLFALRLEAGSDGNRHVVLAHPTCNVIVLLLLRVRVFAGALIFTTGALFLLVDKRDFAFGVFYDRKPVENDLSQ